MWGNEWGGKIIYSDDLTKSKGVAVMFHKNLNISRDDIEFFKDKEGRTLIVTVNIDGKNW